MKKQKGFTLSEVLITIGIVGVVAALSIPVLLTHINNKLNANRREVIECRFLEGLNVFNSQENGFSQEYGNTKEFVEGLSKHYKMVNICAAGEIDKCFPYSEINDDGEILELKNVLSASDLSLDDEEYLSPAAFISANGVPFIISLKKNCIADPYKALHSFSDTDCLAFAYDQNGADAPNYVSKDIIELGGLNIKGYYKKVNNVKLTEPALNPRNFTFGYEQCNAEMAKSDEYGSYPIPACTTYFGNGDAFAYSMYYCKEHGAHSASLTELASIVEGLFYKGSDKNQHPNISVGVGVVTDLSDYNFDYQLASDIGLKNQDGSSVSSGNPINFTILSNQKNHTDVGAYGIKVNSDRVNTNQFMRGGNYSFFCVKN